MNRIFYRALATIGMIGLAYYLYNPRKYNKGAKKMASEARNTLKNTMS